jgi:hypothetical protein
MIRAGRILPLPAILGRGMPKPFFAGYSQAKNALSF